MEFIIAFVIIVLTLLYFVFRKAPEEPKRKRQKKEEEFNKISTLINDIKNSSDNEDLDALVESNKDYIINHFRETRELKNVYAYVSSDKVTLVFNDEKSIRFGCLTSFTEKNMKFSSKSLEQDIISDIGFSEDKGRITVALKNSRELIFYDISTDRSGKKSLTKIDNRHIKTGHKFEIKAIAYAKSGNYVATSGKDDDTSVEIYDAKNLTHLQTIDIKEIKNIEIRFTPDERYLTVSTYMYEIGVIEFKKSAKFNKNTTEEEVTVKLQRIKSIGGIKVPILSYEFSNDIRYFIVSCDNRRLKLFENFPTHYNIEESRVISEIEIKEKNIMFGEKVSMYILDEAQSGCKLNGLIAISYDCSILIYNVEGKLLKYFKNAHETKVTFVKLLNDFTCKENNRKIVLLSASRDGKFFIWDLKLNL